MYVYLHLSIHLCIWMRNTSRRPLDLCHCVCKYVYASEHVYVCSTCRIHVSVCLGACACVRVGARAFLALLYGRSIDSTKVKALPDSLGQCKLLEELCVPRPPPPPPVRVRGGAGAALLRVALPRRALGPAPRGVGCRAGGGVAGRRPSAEPRARMAGARGRPARGKGRAGAARRGRTVGAQVRGRHRARGAAGGGRVAEPQDSVSSPAAALTRPRRCAACGGRVVSARTRRARLGTCVCPYGCTQQRVRVCACLCAHAQNASQRARVRARVRVRARRERASTYCVSLCVYTYVCMYVCMRVCMYLCVHA
jgi:hypothetical protein